MITNLVYALNPVNRDRDRRDVVHKNKAELTPSHSLVQLEVQLEVSSS
jgi:hypothetical protein